MDGLLDVLVCAWMDVLHRWIHALMMTIESIHVLKTKLDVNNTTQILFRGQVSLPIINMCKCQGVVPDLVYA